MLFRSALKGKPFFDWLGDNLSKIAKKWHPTRVYRDDQGLVRVIAAHPTYERLVQRAFEKIRQASSGMPAVMIRQLDALAKIMEYTTTPAQRDILLRIGRERITARDRFLAQLRDMIETFCPISRFMRVLLPAFGTPAIPMNPAR